MASLNEGIVKERENKETQRELKVTYQNNTMT